MDLNGNAKICDFGLCCKLAKHKKINKNEKDITRTAFIAPEIIRNSYDRSVDYWSLGINVYCMLCGEYPVPDQSNQEEMKKKILNDPLPNFGEIRKRNFPKMKEISQNGIDFVQQILKKNPDERLCSENITKHSFYSSINWTNLVNGDLESPFKPYVISFSFFLLLKRLFSKFRFYFICFKVVRQKETVASNDFIDNGYKEINSNNDINEINGFNFDDFFSS